MSSESPLIIYVLPGSQYVAKVLSALTARKVDHYVQYVPLDIEKRKKTLPSGGRFVPEMQVGSGSDKEIICDSEKILHWLDDNRGTKFFPNEEASELSKRASDETLAAMVWYYNWVDDDGHSKSMRASLGRSFPTYVPWFVVDMFLKSTRTEFREKVKMKMKLEDSDLSDGPAMKKRLMDELYYLQDFLKDESQSYLLPGEEPTAPDFSVYAQMERLVGGDASDYPLPPSIPKLKEDTSLKRLWSWHDNMRKLYPIKHKGKRAPKELLS